MSATCSKPIATSIKKLASNFVNSECLQKYQGSFLKKALISRSQEQVAFISKVKRYFPKEEIFAKFQTIC